jgi:hypothetical protein
MRHVSSESGLNRADDVDRVAEVAVALVLAEFAGAEWRLARGRSRLSGEMADLERRRGVSRIGAIGDPA